MARVHLPPSNGEVYLDVSPQKRLRVIFDENTERNYVHFPAHNATLREPLGHSQVLKKKADTLCNSYARHLPVVAIGTCAEPQHDKLQPGEQFLVSAESPQ